MRVRINCGTKSQTRKQQKRTDTSRQAENDDFCAEMLYYVRKIRMQLRGQSFVTLLSQVASM